jgi:hypothetical protein
MFLEFSKNVLVTSLIGAAKMVDKQYRFHLAKRASQEMPMAK